MKRAALLITTMVALTVLLGTGVKIAGSQDSEPIILEPIVKTEECATKFWVQNLGLESAAVTLTFKDEYARMIGEVDISIPSGETRSFDMANMSQFSTGYVGWVEISADQSIAAEIELPKCKTNQTFLHGVMREWGDYVCTSVIQITLELGEHSATRMDVYIRSEEGDDLIWIYTAAQTGNWVLDFGYIEYLGSGYKGYIKVVVDPGVSVEAEIIEQRCEITPTPTSTPTVTSTPTSTSTATPTSTSTPTSTVPPTPTPIDTPTPTPTSTPTATPTSTSTPTSTATPTNTPTATPTATVIYRLYLPVILKLGP
ncbi:MAG: hypothetical protein H8E47_02140 [Anaerolineales bacterium]|nr:hypothetical protein [Anaerolineales bacterium]